MSTVSFLKAFTLAAALSAVVACSSNIKKVDIPLTANPADEISSTRTEMDEAFAAQTNVFAPKNYENAKSHLEKAEKLSRDSATSEKILAEVGYAKAYLAAAKEKSAAATQALGEVTKARQAALAAGAAKYESKRLYKLDDDLKDITSDWEKKDKPVSVDDRQELQKAYLDLELRAIRGTNLTTANQQIESAKSMGAKKLSPKTLTMTEAKYRAAETVINTDRHNESAISTAVAEVNKAASQLVAVTQAAKGVKAGNTEDVALGIVGQSATINSLDQQVGMAQKETNMTAAQLAAKNAQLAASNDQLSAVKGDAQQTAAQLAAEQKFNASFEAARKQFDKNEADVYRQGNQLLIRLKNVNFASGRADIPADSMSSLGKVKDIITEMNAQKVIVEGHTDSVGSKELNNKLSQTRAEAVAKYFETEKAIDSSNVEAKGYGFEKPLTSNKTKAGRAQNRRVDVIITPATM